MILPFDHTHDLDPEDEISRSKSEIALSQEWDGQLTWNEKYVSHPFMTMILTSVTMVGWADVPDSDWGDFRHLRAPDISSLNCFMGSFCIQHIVDFCLAITAYRLKIKIILMSYHYVNAKHQKISIAFQGVHVIKFSLAIFNSLAPGRSYHDFKNVIFNLVLLIGIFKSSYDNVLRWMPQDLTDDRSTLVQVMAWCRQATSHYLNQCWPISPTPYGVTRPQCVKKTFWWLDDNWNWQVSLGERCLISWWRSWEMHIN